MIDIYDPEYAMPGELLTTDYDLRTGPERLHDQVDALQRRIFTLERQMRHVERILHKLLNEENLTEVCQ